MAVWVKEGGMDSAQYLYLYTGAISYCQQVETSCWGLRRQVPVSDYLLQTLLPTLTSRVTLNKPLLAPFPAV